MVKKIILGLNFLFATSVYSQVVINKLPTDPDITKLPVKLEFLKNFSGSNQIKLLNNRFRVDHHVDEVMMLFFRKEGSSPVVLIRPDGSKIYPRDANAKTIEWHAELGYDLIKLHEPMPGPWQAVGKILPDSKILVLSDIELQADPLPNKMFQYEMLKSEARIINAGMMIRDGNIRNVVSLKASFYPSADPDATNFGSDIYRVGEFLDDGKELDERPRDGVFTLQYYIEMAHGEWFPKYRVIAELFTRELDTEAIQVLPSPIEFDVKQAVGQERYHYASVNVNSDYIDDNSLLFQGEVRYPNNDRETFTFEGQQERTVKIFNGEFGVFKIDLQLFGTTVDGREFHLKLPQFQFVTSAPEVAPVEIEIPVMQEIEEPVYIEPKPEFPLVLVIVVNLTIISFGFLLIWLFVLKRSIPNPFSKLMKKKQAEPKAEAEPEKKEKVEEKPVPPPTSDDILDLSLPED